MRPGSPTKNETLFEYGKVEYGDKLVRGVTVRCGYCSKGAQSIRVNGFAVKSGSDELEKAFICRKLEDAGWLVGRNLKQHRCPECYIKIKSSAVRKAREKNEVTEQKSNKVVSIVNASAAEPPREMTRDDRRIIFEKLNEVYQNEKTGYEPGWTDHKVAADLGVPRAWVALIRDENFGEELANEEIRKTVNEAKLILQDVRLAAAGVETALEQYRKMSGVVERLSKSIGEIEKSLGG